MSGRSRDMGRRRSRSRSRSRSRGRDARGSSPRGGADRRAPVSDVTSDPKTVGARIFVGSIDSSMTRESLQDYFSQYGRVLAVTITRNKFGFVQFSRDEEATACLANGTTAYVDGNRIDIKPAKIGSGPMPGERREGAGGGARGGRDGGRNGGRGGRDDFGGRDRSPMRGREDDFYGRDYPYPPGAMERDGRGRFDDRYDDYYRDQYPDRYADYYRQDDPRAPGAADPRGPPGPNEPRGPETAIGATAAGYPPAPQADPLDPLDPTRPNDVEIVVPNKMQRSYAENVEAQLKRMNMLVDLLFPPPDIPPSQVLNDLAARKCLFAIFITEDNEQHRSLTLTILHSGAQQEHRNMPVDDALRLVEQNFGDYVKKIRQRNMREVVPRDIRNLMLDLLEIRPLSMGDLDKMIKFLKERQSLLVDDQIQQKRDSQAGVGGSEPMAVTYPGLPYGSSGGVVGAASGQSGATATSVPLAATAYGSSATAVAGAYSAYGNMGAAMQQTPQSTAYGSYGMAAASQVAPVAAPTMTAVGANKQQTELSERIYNIMKGAGGSSGVPTGVPAPTGVSAPKGVPAPSGVPPPSMVPPVNWNSQQQSGQQSSSNYANSAYGNNLSNSGTNDYSDRKSSGGQQNSGLFAAYTPWSQ
ncbi:unnamed protein product [Meganyctiphanes norvegica]|uniref:RRM domain-containing protein n=1 Tax=Meganyctiphanes norvegica TaxID=48144 RepID=A0AAV2SBN4_MEGNR